MDLHDIVLAAGIAKQNAIQEMQESIDPTLTQPGQAADAAAVGAAVKEIDTKNAEQDKIIDDLYEKAKLIYIESDDGVEYAGKIKVVNGKPIMVYDEFTGGN